MKGDEFVPNQDIEKEVRDIKELCIRTEEAVKQVMEMQSVGIKNLEVTVQLQLDNLRTSYDAKLEIERGKRRGLENRIIIIEEEKKFNQQTTKATVIKYIITALIAAMGFAIAKGWV